MNVIKNLFNHNFTARWMLLLFVFLIFSIRYFAVNTPFVEFNTNFLLYLFLLSVPAGYLFIYGLSELSLKAPFRLFYAWLLVAMVYPLIPAVIFQNAGRDILYDLVPFLLVAGFFGYWRLFTADRNLWPLLFWLLIGLLIIFCFTYLREFLTALYHLVSTKGLKQNHLLRMLRVLKEDNRYLLFISIGGVAVFSYLLVKGRSLFEKRDRALALWLVMAVVIITHVFYFSRNQLISFVFAVTVMLFVSLNRHRLVRHEKLFLNVAAAAMLAAVAVFIIDPLGRLDHQAGKNSTLTIRYNERQQMLKSLDGDYLTGRGHGSKFNYVQFTVDQGRWLTKSHNSFLNYFYKGGVLMFLLYTALFIYFFRISLSRFLHGISLLEQTVALYLTAWFSMMFIRASQDNVFYGVEQTAFFVFHLALFLALREGRMHDRPDNRPL